MARDGKDNQARLAKAGELVLFTAGAALSRLETAALDERQCFEVYLKYKGKEKTKSGGSVNVYEHIIVGQAFARTAETRLPSSKIPARIGTGYESDATDVPFA
jgi:hypothetical protein